MTSHLVDGVLLVALVLTSLRVASMHRELKRLRGYHGEYRQVFSQTSEALGGIEGAIRSLNGEGRAVLEALGERIDEARALAARLEAGSRAAAASRDASPAEPEEETYSPAFLARRGGADQPVNQRAIDFFRELQVVGRDAAEAEHGFDATGERGRRATQRLGAALSR
jgi:hypothetical protein